MSMYASPMYRLYRSKHKNANTVPIHFTLYFIGSHQVTKLIGFDVSLFSIFLRRGRRVKIASVHRRCTGVAAAIAAVHDRARSPVGHPLLQHCFFFFFWGHFGFFFFWHFGFFFFWHFGFFFF